MLSIKCSCGREIPRRANSTIQAKKCPKCTYEDMFKKQRKGPGSILRTETGKLSPVKKKTVNKPKNSSYWMKQADMWYSRYIRLVKSQIIDGEPYCEDIITGKIYHAKNLDAGHMIGRGNMSTRYYDDNVWPQNRSSNRFRGESDKGIFQSHVLAEIGIERYNDIFAAEKKRIIKGTYQLDQISELYKTLVNKIIKEKNIKKWW